MSWQARKVLQGIGLGVLLIVGLEVLIMWPIRSSHNKSRSTEDRIQICAEQPIVLEIIGYNILPETVELKKPKYEFYCGEMEPRDWKALGRMLLIAGQTKGPPIGQLMITFPHGCHISGMTTFLKEGKFEFIVDERCEPNYLGPGILP